MALDRRLDFGSAHWRDVHEVSREDLESLSREYSLPASTLAECLDPDHLPKIQRSGALTFLMLRAFDEKADPGEISVQAYTRKVAIFWGDNYLLTVHRSPLAWIDGVWDTWQSRTAREPGQLGSLVHDLVEECIYTYEAPIDGAGLEVETMEDSIFRNSTSPVTSSDILEAAYLAKKRASMFKRMLRLTRDLLPLLSKLGEPSSPVIQSLKEEADRLYFYSDDLEESANGIVQMSISLTSNRTNEVVRMLTLVSIFLMPLNLVVGIYGMNFEFMPETKWEYGYPMVIALMIAIELGIFWILKKRGWIRARGRR